MTKTISNHKLLDLIYQLDNETLKGTEHSIKNMVQISVLRKAFGVKNDESEYRTYKKFLDYERLQVNTNKDIINKFNDYIKFYKDLPHQKIENILSIKYYIEAVKVFNDQLASQLLEIAKAENVQVY